MKKLIKNPLKISASVEGIMAITGGLKDADGAELIV